MLHLNLVLGTMRYFTFHSVILLLKCHREVISGQVEVTTCSNLADQGTSQCLRIAASLRGGCSCSFAQRCMTLQLHSEVNDLVSYRVCKIRVRHQDRLIETQSRQHSYSSYFPTRVAGSERFVDDHEWCARDEHP